MNKNSKEKYTLENIQQEILHKLRKTLVLRAPRPFSLSDKIQKGIISKRRPNNNEMNMKMNHMLKNFQTSFSLNGVWGLP